VRLYSRPGNDLTYRFPLIAESLARLRRQRNAPRDQDGANGGPMPKSAGGGHGKDFGNRRAYALADRLFRKECARLGLNADEAIKSPLLRIITRQGGRALSPHGHNHKQ
jgi:hypothetical protein